ncbi:hypothetical protein [Chitinophaga polysaccharea]|uniref:hypothetical protein n=1 Tax=Chitinophaga polysaccharea TaxID=1293035 RepID=UPI00163BA23A|nr:hypothetical protein [Chitinophaga polysaccharea]
MPANTSKRNSNKHFKRKHTAYSMKVYQKIALIVVVIGVIVYLVMQSGRKTKYTGNK